MGDGMGSGGGEGGSSNSNDALRLVNYPATVSLILSFSLPFQINEIRRGGAKSSRCRAGAASAASNFSSLSSTSSFGFSVSACVTTPLALIPIPPHVRLAIKLRVGLEVKLEENFLKCRRYHFDGRE